MAKYPKAIQKPITRHDNPMDRYRGICNHVAATEGASLFGYFNQAGNPTSHFYVRRTGAVEQYVDTRFEAPANLEGNHTLISIETQGGATEATANTEPWTAAAVEALAELHAWIHKTHGIPLVLMKDSKPATVGVGYHKLGVDPYRVDGGERWSKAYGKICPGGKKISQIPSIIARAKVLAGTTTEDELSAAEITNLKTYVTDELERFFGFLEKPNGNIDQQLAATEAAVKQMVTDAAEGVRAYTEAATVSIKDYVRQTDNEQDILNAVSASNTAALNAVSASNTAALNAVSALKADVAALNAKVDALPKA